MSSALRYLTLLCGGSIQGKSGRTPVNTLLSALIHLELWARSLRATNIDWSSPLSYMETPRRDFAINIPCGTHLSCRPILPP
ncbi:hypothetical protein N656DRAFT_773577 [Canariomyces notabilis]|uniref:Uncharacterized protein n=1 Tax=Canariomyces notabilis TaxID=2074819 RepID=A0AAN6TNG0_9PEZI|nr:hypothetical protein N656DRAFT_773577 [Canariomyces arenarius]